MSAEPATDKPHFVRIADFLVNTSQIKWVGFRSNGETRVYMEFIKGGWVLFDAGVTLADVQAALT